MKFKAGREELLSAIDTVRKAVERRNTIPILANLKVLANSDSTITLVGTDLDVEMSATIAAEIELMGETTTPAEMLRDIVKKMPVGATIEVETVKESMKVKSGRSRFTLNTLPPQDFPTLNQNEGATEFKVKASEFRSIFDTVQFAMSSEETRYYLCGVYLHTEKEGEATVLRGVSTDGHRLARVQIPLPPGAEHMPAVIVPRKTVGMLPGLLDGDAEVGVEVSATRIVVKAGAYTLSSKLIDGSFPDYRRVIPSGNTIIVRVQRQDFTAAVDRVSTVSSDRGRAVRFDFSESLVKVSVTNPDTGSSEEEIDITGEGFDGANLLTIGFNSKYMVEVLGRAAGETIEMRMADPASPTLILNPNNDNALFVVMPMSVRRQRP